MSWIISSKDITSLLVAREINYVRDVDISEGALHREIRNRCPSVIPEEVKLSKVKVLFEKRLKRNADSEEKNIVLLVIYFCRSPPTLEIPFPANRMASKLVNA